LVIEFQACLQLACLPEGLFQDTSLDLVQFLRSNEIVSGTPVLLLEMLVPQAQKLNEVETLETRSQVIRASCKTHPAGLIFSRLEAKAEDAGGHFWHDMVIETNIITPAK
jgi:hypothetical protein